MPALILFGSFNFSASMSNEESHASAQKLTQTFVVASHTYSYARLSFNPSFGHAELTPECKKALDDVCVMHKVNGAEHIAKTRKALQDVLDRFGAVLPREVVFGGLLTVKSSSNTKSEVGHSL
jgi:hypothetical protein